MNERRSFLDEIDKKILTELQKNCQIPRIKLAEMVKVSLSTINYRIKRLEQEGIIKGYHAHIDFSQIQNEFNICLLVKLKIYPNSIQDFTAKLSSIPEIWGIYATLGTKNFVIFAKTSNQQVFMEKVHKNLLNTNLIEDLEELVVTQVVKEEPGKMVENFFQDLI